MSRESNKKYYIDNDISSKHWSRKFYEDAKAQGYKYAARPHIGDELHKLMKKEELDEVAFFKRWKEHEIVKGINIPADHPEAVKDFKFKNYTPDGEQLIIACLNNGMEWPIGYFMNLEKIA